MINTAYNILRELCQQTDQPVHIIRGLTRFSNRMKFIISKLSQFGCSFEVDSFYMGHHGWYKNIIAYPVDYDPANDTIILMAHHDVYNTAFENANDNSASVAILLSLIHKINKIYLNVNVVVIFTDDEEITAFGSQHTTEKILEGKYSNVLHVINLELSGRGDNIWLEKTNHNTFLSFMLKDFPQFAGQITCPFNDASNMRKHGFKEATTIGSIYMKDEEVDKSIWNDIHSEKDKFDKVDEKSLIMVKDFLLNSIINLNINE